MNDFKDTSNGNPPYRFHDSSFRRRRTGTKKPAEKRIMTIQERLKRSDSARRVQMRKRQAAEEAKKKK